MEKFKELHLVTEELNLKPNEASLADFPWFAGRTIDDFYSSKITEIQDSLKTKSLEDFDVVNAKKASKEYAASIKVKPIKIIEEGIVEVNEVNDSMNSDEMFYQFIYKIKYNGDPILFELYHKTIPELFYKPYSNDYDISKGEGSISFALTHTAEDMPSREELIVEVNNKVKGFRETINVIGAQMKIQGDAVESKIKAILLDRNAQLQELARLNQDYVEVFYQAKG